jgi:Xaa-Pro dipeptidase
MSLGTLRAFVTADRPRSVHPSCGRKRLAAAAQLCRSRRLDCLLFADPADVLALSGFDLVGTFYLTAVIVPAEREPLLFAFRAERGLAKKQSWIERVDVWSHGEDGVGRLIDTLHAAAAPTAERDRRPLRVGLDADRGLTVAQVQRLSADARLRLVDVPELREETRWVLTAEQRPALAAAARAAAATVQAACAAVRPGRSEHDVASAMERAYWSAGGGEPGRPISVASGRRTADPHATPTARMLIAGDRVNVRCWATVDRASVVLGETYTVGRGAEYVDSAAQRLTAAIHDLAEYGRAGISAGDLCTHPTARALADAGALHAVTLGDFLGLSYPRRPSDEPITAGGQRRLRLGEIVVLSPNAPDGPGTVARLAATYEVTAVGLRSPTAVVG